MPTKREKAIATAWQTQDANREVPQLSYLATDQLKAIQDLPRQGPELGIKLDTIRQLRGSPCIFPANDRCAVKHIQALRRADTDAKVILCECAAQIWQFERG